MLRAKRIPAPLNNSASIVRHRLLHDRHMRRHSSAVVALSPAEQHRHAIQIAHCFKNHYLAAIDYRDDCQMTVAVVRPINSRQPVQEIWVDHTGNVTVHRRDIGPLLNLSGRLVLIPGLLVVAFAVLLLAVYL